jgi:LytS/YehU family sensor histidine kinase
LFLLFWLLQKGQNSIAARQMEEEKKLTKQQMALSKKQLEPHFMLNTLNNIGNMFAKEEKEDAQYYFGKFASLLHRGLMYADKTETSLFDELGFVRDYLVLQQRRYDDLSFKIEASEKIDLESVLIPHSLIYTFVENALKHGLRDKVGKKKLDITIENNNEKLEILIRDNGVGRKGSKKFSTSGTGKGLEIIENIVSAYNKLNNRNISFVVLDLQEGVEVVIKLK